MGGIFQGHTTLSFVLDDEAKRACSVTAGHTVATAFTISLLNGLGDNEKLYVSLIFIAFLFTPLSFDLRVSLSLCLITATTTPQVSIIFQRFLSDLWRITFENGFCFLFT